jgi:hypothetical protein
MRVSLFKHHRPRPIATSISSAGRRPSWPDWPSRGAPGSFRSLTRRSPARPQPRSRTRRPAVPAEPLSTGFTDSARDQVFSLTWKAENSGDRVRIDGRLENREGPEVADVTLQIVLWRSGEMPLTQQRVTLAGVLASKDSRPFVVNVPTSAPPSRVSVEVYAYRVP